MNTYLRLSDIQKRDLCEAASNAIGLAAASIEKDFWICWTLRELFALPEIGTYFIFKGGTSLSKCWKLISRFSEDLDVTVDRDNLGFGGDRSPEAAASKSRREKLLVELQSACGQFVRETLSPALTSRIPAGKLSIDDDDVDGQALLFQYPSVFPAGRYLRPSVKIELGARSDTDPHETPEIRPYLAEALPGELGASTFHVRALSPRRTFWEKAMLLHEETYRNEAPKARLARHYYDLWCLIRSGVAAEAAADHELFDRVAAHRKVFFRRSREAQDTLKRGSLRLVPVREHRLAWNRDYEAMREAMFFEEAPNFIEVVIAIQEFEEAFNKSA